MPPKPTSKKKSGLANPRSLVRQKLEHEYAQVALERACSLPWSRDYLVLSSKLDDLRAEIRAALEAEAAEKGSGK